MRPGKHGFPRVVDAVHSPFPGYRSREGTVKRLFAAASLVILAVTGAASARPLAPPTRQAGTLTVGFDVPAPGFWNGRVTGTTIKNGTGFEYALSQAIAKQLGLAKVTYVRAPFGGLFSPAPKKYDFAL